MNRFEKAALFGNMFSRKFTPDRKLQQALLAEREKLMDIWEEGGTDWSPETHPDMGGNPDFNRRWNKAFNSKEEVEPKAPPTPLHESKPSWFPFRTQGMIDKARDAEYLRSDNEEAWDANDWKTEMALRDDHTREGVNNILNHYLDRNHGIVKNPYKAPADLDGRVDYKGLVQKNVPWKPSTDIDNINALFEETQFPDYKSPANRQKLFDQYYPYLDLSPSAKPIKKGPIAKAAAFGAMMGKLAAGEAPASPQPSARDIQIHNSRMELQRKGQMVRDAAGGNGAYGTSRGTMKDGVIQPGATFTRQEGQQSQKPLPGAGGQINSPPVPRGMQPVPPASSPVIESKTPRRLF